MDILVSHYNNKSYIDLLKCFKNLSDSSITYSIYNKSNEIIPNTYKLDNIGRESDSYLHYIIENYDKLNEYTLFLQDDVDNHIVNYQEFANLCFDIMKNKTSKFKIFNVRWRPGYAPISRTIVNGKLNLHTLPSNTSILDLCEYMNIKLPDVYTTETCAFMIIHKNNILKHSKEFYVKLRKWLLLNDYVKNAIVLEHCWKIIFN